MAARQIPDIRPFMENDQAAIRYYLIFAIIIFLIGLIIVGSTFLPFFKMQVNAQDPISKTLQDLGQKIGGAFVSSLSAFPIKEFITRRDRLRVLLALEKLIQELRSQSDPSDDDVKRLSDFVWEIYKKGTTG